MAEAEPTLWELMRAITRLEGKLDNVLTVEVFRAYQEGTDRRFGQVETDIAEWKVESRGEHTALDAKIVALRDRADTTERVQREARSRNWLAVGIAVLSCVLSIGGGLILAGVTGGA